MIKLKINEKSFIYYQLLKYILKWNYFYNFIKKNNNLGCDIVDFYKFYQNLNKTTETL